MTSSYYRPSGAVPASGICIVVGFAVAAIPLARLYGWATFRAPFVPDVLIVLVMCMCVGLLVRGAAGVARIRNPHWMRLAGAGCGFFVWYVQWAAWLAYAGVAESPLYLGLRPWTMIAAILETLAELPWLGAACLVVCWLVEMLLLMLPAAMAGSLRAAEPFCEKTGQWASKVDVDVQFETIENVEAVRRRLERNPGELASVLMPCAGDALAFAELTLYRCDGGDSFVTITNYVAAEARSTAHEQTAALLAMPAREVEVVLQIDDPVVELLRLPTADVDPFIRQVSAAGSAA
ncbi:MAG: hypothetical protein AB1807_20840 [Pseudomonadota bacterium]